VQLFRRCAGRLLSARLHRGSLPVLQTLGIASCAGSDDEAEAADAADGKAANIEDAEDDESDQSTAEHHNGIVPKAATLQKNAS
jgi:hypothetical protein